jgi:pimeloyl-ACP methyl ester carboxylesterase
MPARFFLPSLLFTSYFLIFSPPAKAASIYNRYLRYPEQNGLDVEKENTDFQDATHPCFRSQGRSFQLTHPDTFKLSGLSVYVFVPGNNEARFSPDFFRFSFLDGSHQSIITRIAPTYTAVIARGGAQPTFEVFFPLDVSISGGATYTAVLECLTDDTNLFFVPESSRISDGLTRYHDSTTLQDRDYYMAGRKILFTTFIQRGGPHFPAIATNNPQPVTNNQPKFHPVIFVHGLGGDPTNFESDAENRNYVKLLTDLGYPREYIHLYSYGYIYDPLKRVNYYNYQGDVREIAQGMEASVNTLSNLHKSQGGNGRVDIVAHSLGNLVTRQYLVTHRDNHKIRRYIAVGAPFKGAWPMGVDAGIRSFPVLGPYLEKQFSEAIVYLINRTRTDRKLDKSSIVYTELTPNSDYLNSLNATAISGVEVYALYGDANAIIRQKIFNKNLEKKVDFGDGLILASSASYTDWAKTSNKYAFNDKVIFNVSVQRQGSALATTFQLSDPTMVRTLHSDLLTNANSKQKIECILINENTGGC